MKSRTVAAILGLIAGIAAFLTLIFSWTASLAFLRLDHIAMLSGLAAGPAKAAWAVCGGFAAFCIIASLVALIAGMAETAKLRRALSELRLDPAMAGLWNAADWRAAFAPTAVAEQAEAMVTILPVERDEPRHVVVDAPLLLGLNGVWLDRLSLAGTIRPIPVIVLGIGATLALFAYDSGDKWDAAAAAGTAGWFAIGLAHYLVRAALAPLVGAAVADATAAIRPLNTTLPPERHLAGGDGPAQSRRMEQAEAEIIAAAISRVIWEPLSRLADSAEKMTTAGSPLSRDQEIEAALAEVRAGIERLLDSTDG